MADKKSRRISTLGSRATSLVSVALVLVLLGLAALMTMAGKSLTDELRRNLGFIVKMERQCPEQAINAMKQALLASPAVDMLTYSSADDIMAQESEFLGDDIGSMLDANPYSPEFDIKVRPDYAAPDSIIMLTERFASLDGVAEVVTESAVIEGVDSTLRRVSSVLLIVAAILLIVSVTLINNTISLSIYARRFVIHTMKLVGATRGFIRRPFLRASALSGLLSGLVASAVITALRVYAPTVDPMLDGALPWTVVAGVCVIITATGVMICTATAVFATNRYLKASYDEMFLK